MFNNQTHNLSSKDYDDFYEAQSQLNLLEIKLDSWHKNALILSPPLNRLKVLEVGCGVGDFAIYLSTEQADVTAVDFSSKAIEVAVQKSRFQNKPVKFYVADAQNLPFTDSSFDLIFSCECLEHVTNPKLALAEFYRVLKSSGKLILTTENYSNFILILWLMCYLRKQPFNSGKDIQPIEHFFLFWRVKRMLNSVGFTVLKMIGSHHVFLLLPRFHPWTFVKEKFQNPLATKLFRPFARHMAFEAIKK